MRRYYLEYKGGAEAGYAYFYKVEDVLKTMKTIRDLVEEHTEAYEELSSLIKQMIKDGRR